MNRFIIVTLPRSGSYHLAALLNSMSDIRCYGEVLKKKFVELPTEILDRLGLSSKSIAERNSDALTFLENVFQLTEENIVGFKAFPEHLRRLEVDQILEMNEFRVIFLTRNPLETFVSDRRAQKTGVYILTDGEQISDKDRHLPIHVDVKELEQRVIWQEALYGRWMKRMSEMGAERAFHVDYSELNCPVTINKMLTFLGSTGSNLDVSSSRVKQFIRPFAEGVENFDEVKKHLQQLGRGELLKAVTNSAVK